MGTGEKIVALVTGVLMVTTLVLPGRQTPAILEKFFGGASQLAKTTIGQG